MNEHDRRSCAGVFGATGERSKHDRRATGSAESEAPGERPQISRFSHSLDLAPATLVGAAGRCRPGAEHPCCGVSQGHCHCLLRPGEIDRSVGRDPRKRSALSGGHTRASSEPDRDAGAGRRGSDGRAGSRSSAAVTGRRAGRRSERGSDRHIDEPPAPDSDFGPGCQSGCGASPDTGTNCQANHGACSHDYPD
jgi:hypothetical protein